MKFFKNKPEDINIFYVFIFATVFGCPGEITGIKEKTIFEVGVSDRFGSWNKDPLNPGYVYYYSPAQKSIFVSQIKYTDLHCDCDHIEVSIGLSRTNGLGEKFVRKPT